MSSVESANTCATTSRSVKQEEPCSDVTKDTEPESHEIDTILHSYREFCSRWDDIKLGKETGSKALNAYLENIGALNPYEKRYSPKDLMHMFETLFPLQDPPPPGSNVFKFLKKNSDGNGYEYTGGTEQCIQGHNNLCHIKAVAKAYAVISTQRDEISNKKRKMYDLSATAVENKLASYDDEMARLKAKEQDILKTSKDLGLLRETSI